VKRHRVLSSFYILITIWHTLKAYNKGSLCMFKIHPGLVGARPTSTPPLNTCPTSQQKLPKQYIEEGNVFRDVERNGSQTNFGDAEMSDWVE